MTKSHFLLDALAAARAELKLRLDQQKRRVYEQTQHALSAGNVTGTESDPIQLGRKAATCAMADYFLAQADQIRREGEAAEAEGEYWARGPEPSTLPPPK